MHKSKRSRNGRKSFSKSKGFVPTIIPLVLSSIAGTEERALTLEARGFSSGIKPTHLYDIVKNRSR